MLASHQFTRLHLAKADMRADKFLRLTRQALGEPGAEALFERLQRLEDEENLQWLLGV